MASFSILTEALFVVEDAREDAVRGRRAFGNSLLRTLSSAGDVDAPFKVPVYPRDAQSQDLRRIGQDMYRAMERHAETQGS